jgi:hypothetical protein
MIYNSELYRKSLDIVKEIEKDNIFDIGVKL